MREATPRREAVALVRWVRDVGLCAWVDQLVFDLMQCGLDGPGVEEAWIELTCLVQALDHFAPTDEELARAA